jgi:broad specificity phosphatase PhoE
MKPKNIFLIRHGESVGNVDKSVYLHTPDWKIPLTYNGREQARLAGSTVHNLGELSSGWMIYTSPYKRAVQTTEMMLSEFHEASIDRTSVKEDPRLREQEYGNFSSPEEYDATEKERIHFGPFFYRFHKGESGADVYDRCSGFLESLYRDFEKESFPDNVIIVTHGFTLRVFLMRWFRYDVEYFHRLRNPDNAEIFHMALDRHTGKYNLKTPLKLRNSA